jgi:hypothetical protein
VAKIGLDVDERACVWWERLMESQDPGEKRRPVALWRGEKTKS